MQWTLRVIALSLIGAALISLPLRHSPNHPSPPAMTAATIAVQPEPTPPHAVTRSLHRQPLPKPTPIRSKKPHHVIVARPRIVAAVSGAYAWAHSAFALKVTHCEAPGGPTELDNNGGVYYFGKWQMNEDFVRTYGGVNPWDYVRHGKFMMPESMQDSIAYKGWRARGWEPWACASMV